MLWYFAKYVGCGNDFIIFDNRNESFPYSDKKGIKGLCHRQCGVGADGVILLENSVKADFRMRIFNADGSEAEMCGNGIRCFVKYCHNLFPAKKSFTVETMHRLHKAAVEQEGISVDMGDPTEFKEVTVPFQNQILDFHFINTGVPHAVHFHPDIDTVELDQLGPYIRHHPSWGPPGTNVTLVQQLDKQRCKIRTFERGVEGETLGCGTGAAAATLAVARLHKLTGPLTIDMKGGSLKIGFHNENGIFSNLTMTGPAFCTFQGHIAHLEQIQIH